MRDCCSNGDSHLSSVFDLRVSIGAESTISDCASITLQTGKDRRCFSPPPGHHLV
ncbi:Bgt-21006 [Blumeria graminis f. sp. tritici]|uniref:Bgt-21006 n=2 Tax=Blumeria graminis f. sp. tritici TaxID=62690 RepID=A0A9X9QDZ9_BLUGR|nr:Bgt-21006 [Blumeria graminis f. sp. tritici]